MQLLMPYQYHVCSLQKMSPSILGHWLPLSNAFPTFQLSCTINLIIYCLSYQSMDADTKTYTFKSESSTHLHQYTLNFQPLNSPTFKTSEKAQSPPLKQNYKNTSHSESSGPILANSRRRRHRIFEQHRLFSQEESLSAGKKKRNSIFGQSNRVHGSESEKVSLKGEPPMESPLGQSLKSPFQCKQLIERKLTERLSNGGFGAEMHIKEKVALKEREIRCLRMEIERSRRCETINKQNEDLSRRLANKLKERANHSFHQTYKQPVQTGTPIHRLKPALAETPIHSLKEIKFAHTASESPQKQTPIQIPPNQPMHTAPLKTIPENEENQLYTESKTEALPTEPAVQFKATSKTKGHREKRSPTKSIENDPIYLEIRQKLNEHQSGFKRNINEIPLNFRLQEMNRHLESSFNAYSKRAYSRPQSQSSQKTKRVDQSLKKSHYYIMMQ